MKTYNSEQVTDNIKYIYYMLPITNEDRYEAEIRKSKPKPKKKRIGFECDGSLFIDGLTRSILL